MGERDHGPGGTVAGALAGLRDCLSLLARADATELTAAGQADCLRALEAAESMHTAARAAVLTAFTNGSGYEDDGHGSARTWLTWQARVTRGAASGAIGWARRLAAHPSVHGALAAGQISASWARKICDWSDLLPEPARADTDVILLAAAAAGADLADLALLAAEIRLRTAGPDAGDDGFDERGLQLDTTFRGAGRLTGDLTPQCAAAVQAVLDALGKKAGPEDIRTRRQRQHDALEEACRRLIGSGNLPDRSGQPAQIQLHMTLDDLMRWRGYAPASAGAPGSGPGVPAPGFSGPGARGPSSPRGAPLASPSGERARDAATDNRARATAAGPGPAAGPGWVCDASIVPMVSGRLDPAVLSRLCAELAGRNPGRAGRAAPACRVPGGPGRPEDPAQPGTPPPETSLPARMRVSSGPGGRCATS